ncbi:MAG: metallophosphatase family protein [Lachnospiraceae bacterium]|nr:metallophosphatase family protein [Lachnospiraceae bacterium]
MLKGERGNKVILAILSDVHGNMNALEAVLHDISMKRQVDAFILLGDLIDYGPHSNEVIARIKAIDRPILCNIYGNHEDAIIKQNYERFSSDRGRKSAGYTRQILKRESFNYIQNQMSEDACLEFTVADRKCLAVHGSLDDRYWGRIQPGDELNDYYIYDYVFSGHSHEPHFFEKYYKVENLRTRNRKKTIFINPGSVGQPRNINNHAQYAIIDTDTESLNMIKIPYNIEEEMMSFSERQDLFYRDRLRIGV